MQLFIKKITYNILRGLNLISFIGFSIWTLLLIRDLISKENIVIPDTFYLIYFSFLFLFLVSFYLIKKHRVHYNK